MPGVYLCIAHADILPNRVKFGFSIRPEHIHKKFQCICPDFQTVKVWECDRPAKHAIIRELFLSDPTIKRVGKTLFDVPAVKPLVDKIDTFLKTYTPGPRVLASKRVHCMKTYTPDARALARKRLHSMKADPSFITAKELAKKMNCTVAAIGKAIRRGDLKDAIQVSEGGTWFVPKASTVGFSLRPKGRRPKPKPLTIIPPRPVPEIVGVEYRSLADYPGFLIGSNGTVWSCWKNQKMTDRWHEVKGSGHPSSNNPSSNNRYRKMSIRTSEGNVVQRALRILVLTAFVGPCPNGMTAQNYPDPDLHNNRLDNLRWAPRDRRAHRQAVLDALTGDERIHQRGDATGAVILPPDEVYVGTATGPEPQEEMEGQ